MAFYIFAIWFLYIGAVLCPCILAMAFSIYSAKERRTTPEFWLGAVSLSVLAIIALFWLSLAPYSDTRQLSPYWYVSYAFWDLHLIPVFCAALLCLILGKWRPVLWTASLGISSAGVVWPVLFMTGISRDVVKALGYVFKP